MHCVALPQHEHNECIALPHKYAEVMLLRMLLLLADVNNKKTLDFLASLR